MFRVKLYQPLFVSIGVYNEIQRTFKYDERKYWFRRINDQIK